MVEVEDDDEYHMYLYQIIGILGYCEKSSNWCMCRAAPSSSESLGN